MNIWEFQERLSRRLLRWSWTSVAGGLLLQAHPEQRIRGVGQQAAGWGLVDAAIALIGRASARKLADRPDSTTAAFQHKEATRLQRLLLVNAGLDLLYVAGGLLLWRREHSLSERWRGHGLGIIIQGSFLFFFDLWHAAAGAPHKLGGDLPSQAGTSD